MNPLEQPDFHSEARASSRLLDVLIRAALIAALAILCYRVFSPFLSLMAWSLILAVTLYPVHQWLARRVRKQWCASAILVIFGLILFIAPTALLMNSFADSVRTFISNIQHNTLQIPPSSERVASWPIVGKEINEIWTKAHADLPGLVQSLQPKLGELAQKALGIVAGIGGGLLVFVASFIIASIVMAYGQSGASSSRAIFRRLAGARGEELAKLCTSTIRAVALGVLGVAFIQAMLIGLALVIARVPAAGVLSIIALILGIAQVPALIVTLPVIVYIWWSGDYGYPAAITHTIILLVAGVADNVLKPLMLGRGVDVPMPVILFGALGGMASGGILGMFVGATLLALGHTIFMGWVATNPESELASSRSAATGAGD